MITEDVKYTFTREERLEHEDELAQATQKVFALETEKSETNSLLNSQLKTANNRVADLSRKISQGFEMRPTEVLVVLNEPVSGMKRIINLSTSEVLREEAMTPEELQGNLFSGEATE